MIHDDKELARIRLISFLIAGCGWAWLILSRDRLTGQAHCLTVTDDAVSLLTSLTVSEAMRALTSAFSSWTVMLVAMMLPSLVSPIYYVCRSSFTHRRLRSIALFLCGYGAIWAVAGALLVMIELALDAIAPRSYLPVTLLTLIAAVWQVSPAKQKSLNNCHSHGELAAFGTAADVSAFRFGVTHGMWCICSCWLLMFCSMLVPKGHLVTMMIIAVLLLCEKLENPRIPSWRLRGAGRVMRMLVAQTRIRWISQSPRLAQSSET